MRAITYNTYMLIPIINIILLYILPIVEMNNEKFKYTKI